MNFWVNGEINYVIHAVLFDVELLQLNNFADNDTLKKIL